VQSRLKGGDERIQLTHGTAFYMHEPAAFMHLPRSAIGRVAAYNCAIVATLHEASAELIDGGLKTAVVRGYAARAAEDDRLTVGL